MSKLDPVTQADVLARNDEIAAIVGASFEGQCFHPFGELSQADGSVARHKDRAECEGVSLGKWGVGLHDARLHEGQGDSEMKFCPGCRIVTLVQGNNRDLELVPKSDLDKLLEEAKAPKEPKP